MSFFRRCGLPSPILGLKAKVSQVSKEAGKDMEIVLFRPYLLTEHEGWIKGPDITVDDALGHSLVKDVGVSTGK